MWVSEKARRMHVLTLIVTAVIMVLVLRLVWLQVLQGAQYKQVADKNRIRQITAPAPRGTMYDRNGAVLVTNRPSFAVSIIPAEYSNPGATPLVAEFTGISQAEIEKMLKDGENFPYTPVRIKRDVDETVVTKIEEHKQYLPGVVIEAVPVRQYVYNTLAAHVLGYVGHINASEYEQRKQQGYHPSDLIGKDGLEREREDVLRGIDGGRQVEVNAMGEEIRVIGDKTAVTGKHLVLTLDANLQKVAEDALAVQITAARGMGQPAKGGAAVVLDVRTGGVRVLASLPAFDPNLFAGGAISSRDWNALITDPNNPLTNRAISNTYPPGSVFKIVTAAAALDMNVTTPQEVFDDKGVYILNGWSFYGWEPKGLGKLTLPDALAWSSDPVFYELGRRVGPDNLASYALTLGLGRKTGIRLSGEENGVVPTTSWKLVTYGEEWYPGETLIAAIGQGYYLVTPLQQAILLMAVANGGIIYKPMLVDKVLSPDGALLEQQQPEVIRTVYLKPETWDTIRKGLVAVTTRGTAASVFQGLGRTVAGKTGSAETGRGTTHSWFACYAPAENPEIAVAVFVEEGGEGSVAAAPVVRKILDAYFGKVRH